MSRGLHSMHQTSKDQQASNNQQEVVHIMEHEVLQVPENFGSDKWHFAKTM